MHDTNRGGLDRHSDNSGPEVATERPPAISGLAESKEFHAFSVDKKNVFEIEGEAVRFLFQYAPKHVDMFSGNPAAYEQHHETFSANDSIDSAAHFGLSVQSFHSFYRSGLPRSRFVKHLYRARHLTHDSRRNNPIGFPSLPSVCFTEEC